MNVAVFFSPGILQGGCGRLDKQADGGQSTESQSEQLLNALNPTVNSHEQRVLRKDSYTISGDGTVKCSEKLAGFYNELYKNDTGFFTKLIDKYYYGRMPLYAGAPIGIYASALRLLDANNRFIGYLILGFNYKGPSGVAVPREEFALYDIEGNKTSIEVDCSQQSRCGIPDFSCELLNVDRSAPLGRVKKTQFAKFDNKREKIWQSLVKANYIDQEGIIKEKFKRIYADDLSLGANITQEERYDIFKILFGAPLKMTVEVTANWACAQTNNSALNFGIFERGKDLGIKAVPVWVVFNNNKQIVGELEK